MCGRTVHFPVVVEHIAICFFYVSHKQLVAMEFVLCSFIVAAVFILSSVLRCTLSYQENAAFYTSESDSHNWMANKDFFKVNVSINLMTAVGQVDSRFVSVTLDSSLVDRHWSHLDFRYDIMFVDLMLCSYTDT